MSFILIQSYWEDYGSDGYEVGSVCHTFQTMDEVLDHLVEKSKWTPDDCVLVEGGTVIEFSEYREVYDALCRQKTEREQEERRQRKEAHEREEYQRLRQKFEGVD